MCLQSAQLLLGGAAYARMFKEVGIVGTRGN